MTGEEIQLDRYAKFRKLGQFQEFAVRGGDWKTAVAERAAVSS
jgi:acetyl-CoA carboxylase carboxyl transferase subunit alpha